MFYLQVISRLPETAQGNHRKSFYFFLRGKIRELVKVQNMQKYWWCISEISQENIRKNSDKFCEFLWNAGNLVIYFQLLCLVIIMLHAILPVDPLHLPILLLTLLSTPILHTQFSKTQWNWRKYFLNCTFSRQRKLREFPNSWEKMSKNSSLSQKEILVITMTQTHILHLIFVFKWQWQWHFSYNF